MRSKTMTEFRPIVAYSSTEVTDRVMSRKLIVPLAMRAISSLPRGLKTHGNEWKDEGPYYVLKLINACDVLLMRQMFLDYDGIPSHCRIPVIRHTVAMTAMSLSYFDKYP